MRRSITINIAVISDKFKSGLDIKGIPVTNPNKLWMRMSDATHPNALGYLAFFRELAPLFDLDTKLSWEH
jgi:lysophospholipase L1-like esterase